MKIGIIGAGLSGLVTAKTLKEYGHEVLIFEKENELGGVWASSRHYPGMTTQNTRDTYAFSDFPMPKSLPEFPTGSQVLEYLKSYAKTFNVLQLIKFNHQITETILIDNSELHYWKIKGKSNDTTIQYTVDFMIICSGTFSEPNIPEFHGMTDFANAGGQVIHSTQVKNVEAFVNKCVAVIGYGKSACDIASALPNYAQKTYIIFREPKWKVPKRILGINYKYFILSRFGEALTKLKYRNSIELAIHFLGISKMLLLLFQKIFSHQQLLKDVNLQPNIGLGDMVFGELSIESESFFKYIREHKIIRVKAQVEGFTHSEIVLDGGTPLKVDVVIFGTGFIQKLSFLPDHVLRSLLNKNEDYELYRNILPVHVPQLAFNGYNTSFFCNLSSEIAALWIAEYLKGKISTPSSGEMQNQIVAHHKWRRNYRLNSWFHGTSVYPFNITYVDQLLKDMNAKLPWYHLLSEWLLVVEPNHYKRVKETIKRRK